VSHVYTAILAKLVTQLAMSCGTEIFTVGSWKEYMQSIKLLKSQKGDMIHERDN